jgi:hypothetical protein
VHSLHAKAGNEHKCPFCNSHRGGKTAEEKVEEVMKRVESYDAGAICVLGLYYKFGGGDLQQDQGNGATQFGSRAWFY